MSVLITRGHFANAGLVSATLYFVALLIVDIRLGQPLGSHSLVAVSGVGAIASLSAMLLPVNLRTSVALSAVSVGASLLLIEFVLHLVAFRSVKRGEVADEQPFDTRSKLEVVQQSYGTADALIPSVSPTAFISDTGEGNRSVVSIDGIETLPLSDVSNSRILFCNEAGRWEIFDSDEQGFNNPKGLWTGLPVELVTVGDSFVQGFCVAPGADMGSIIRREYPTTVNLGIQNTGPLTQLGIVREYARRLRPKTVLWFYYEGNDFRDLRQEADIPLLRRYVDRGVEQGLADKRNELDSAMLAHVEAFKQRLTAPANPWSERLHATLSLRYLRALVHLRGDQSFQDVLPLFRRVMVAGKDLIEEWGGQLVFVYLPDWRRYYGMTRPSDGSDGLRSQVISVMEDLDVKVIDIHHTFRSTQDPSAMFVRPDKHYSQLGYATAAAAIISELSDTEISTMP